MHGMADIIIVVMAKEQSSKINIKTLLIIAMIVISIVIAIILINVIKENNYYRNEVASSYDRSKIIVKENDDEKLNAFFNDYFNAKLKLDYPCIFSFYGKDYYEEERKNATFKNIINRLKYEKVFIESYDNIKIYTCDGYRSDEKVCIVTYDLELGFTDVSAPMIILFCLKETDGGYVIDDNIDVGTSKYLVDVTSTKAVEKIYNDVAMRLEQATLRSESLKLVYNTIRQFEVNQNVELDDLYRNGYELESIALDPIKDIDKICNIIVDMKAKKETKERIDRFLSNIIASNSDIVE